MPYIGRGPAKSGAFRILDDVSGSFNGSTTSFALTVGSAALTVGLPETLLIAVDGVVQEAGSAYTISGSNIVFTAAPQADATFWGVELGDVGGIAQQAVTQSAGDNSTSIATTAYVDAQVATEDTIAEMGDVTLSSIGSGEVLKWNGSAWINNNLAELGVLPVANPTFTGAISGATIAGNMRASAAQTSTGTSDALAVTPDGLAGSVVFGTRYVQCVVFDSGTDIAEGNGKFFFHIPAGLNGMNLVETHARVATAGSGSAVQVQLFLNTSTTNAATGNDMLTNLLTIDDGELDSADSGVSEDIDETYDDVDTNDMIRIDVDGNGGDSTVAKGLIVTLGFRLP